MNMQFCFNDAIKEMVTLCAIQMVAISCTMTQPCHDGKAFVKR